MPQLTYYKVGCASVLEKEILTSPNLEVSLAVLFLIETTIVFSFKNFTLHSLPHPFLRFVTQVGALPERYGRKVVCRCIGFLN